MNNYDVEVVASSPDTCRYVQIKSDTFWVPYVEIEKQHLTHHHVGHSQLVSATVLKAAYFDYMEFANQKCAEELERDFICVGRVDRRARNGCKLWFDADGRQAWVPNKFAWGRDSSLLRREIWDHFLKVPPDELKRRQSQPKCRRAKSLPRIDAVTSVVTPL